MTAAFGLAGAIIGALASFGGAAYIEWRRDQRAARTAVRVLRVELNESIVQAKLIRELGIWLLPGRFPLADWEKQRHVAAAALSEPDWKLLSRAYDWVSTLNSSCELAANPDSPAADYKREDEIGVNVAISVMEEASERLDAIGSR